MDEKLPARPGALPAANAAGAIGGSTVGICRLEVLAG
jgi:hypothetical protein